MEEVIENDGLNGAEMSDDERKALLSGLFTDSAAFLHQQKKGMAEVVLEDGEKVTIYYHKPNKLLEKIGMKPTVTFRRENNEHDSLVISEDGERAKLFHRYPRYAELSRKINRGEIEFFRNCLNIARQPRPIQTSSS